MFTARDTERRAVAGYVSSLLPMLNEYIELRRSLASKDTASSSATKEAPVEVPTEGDEATPQTPSKSDTLKSDVAVVPTIVLPNRTNSSAPMPVPIERTRKPKTSREYLSHIAWLSEEVLRASQEKVNLAQATYDSVRLIPPFQYIFIGLTIFPTCFDRQSVTSAYWTSQSKNRKPP